MKLIALPDPHDPRLESYRSIRERDIVGRQGRFIVEGTVVLRALLAAGRFELESLMVLESRLSGLSEILAQLPPRVPVFAVSQAVIDEVAGFHVHRGVLGVGLRGAVLAPSALLDALPDDALVVAPIGISNHDNIGAIFRNAAAFEADALLLDETCCDPLYRKSIRVSVGGALTVPFHHGGTAGGLLDLLAQREMRLLALTPGGDIEITALEPGGPTALLLGSEGDGLPEEILGRTTRVRIPMSRKFDSLNVAAAAAIALHHLWRGQRPPAAR